MSIANPHLHNKDDEEVNKLKRWAVIASLSVAGILIVTKFIAYTLTGSVSILSSLMDSSFDALASLAAFVSVLHAATPADKNHRFGHGKAEALSAAGQALFIFCSAIFLFFKSISHFMNPQTVEHVEIGLAVMALSIALTITLVVFQVYVLKKTKSVAIMADHLHYKGDLLMNLGVMITLGIGMIYSSSYLDPLFALGVSIYLLYGARNIAKQSFDILMDRELPDDMREKILQLTAQHPKAHDVHDLRTRTTGDRIFIELHLELDGAMSLDDAHDVTEEIEKVLYEEFPTAEVIIHQEPAGIDDHRLDEVIK